MRTTTRRSRAISTVTYYFYDWSGDSPDTTDDGPLRWDTTRLIEVDYDHCYVPVIKVLEGSTKSRVGVTHLGLVKFFKIVDRDHPHLLEQKLDMATDEKALAIFELLALGKVTTKGLRAVS
jgi:hypothetical protein